MIDSFWLFLFSQIVAAISVYTAVRSDIREAQVRIAMLEKHNERTTDKCKLSK